jgi:hypothetical protein
VDRIIGMFSWRISYTLSLILFSSISESGPDVHPVD